MIPSGLTQAVAAAAAAVELVDGALVVVVELVVVDGALVVVVELVVVDELVVVVELVVVDGALVVVDGALVVVVELVVVDGALVVVVELVDVVAQVRFGVQLEPAVPDGLASTGTAAAKSPPIVARNRIPSRARDIFDSSPRPSPAAVLRSATAGIGPSRVGLEAHRC